MTTIRRNNRLSGPGVSARAVALFAEAEPLTAGRDACTESDEMCTHATCDRHIDLEMELHRELGLRPWHQSPLRADEEPLIPSGTDWEKSRPMIQELRRELLARAKAAKR
jgi:hypothetical protein